MLDDLELPEVDPATAIDDVMKMITSPGTPFATEKQVINGIEQTVFANQPQNLRDVFMMFAAHGDKEFIVYRDTRLTFAETIAKASQFAQALKDDFGVKKGDRVAIAMRNYPEWPIAYMGIVAAGGIAVLMNAWWKSDELTWALDNCGAKLVVSDAQRAHLVTDMIEAGKLSAIIARDTFEPRDGLHDFDAACEGKTPMTWPEIELNSDDVAMMLYTSGSTGFPKGAPSTHRAVISVIFTWIVIALSLKMLGRTNPDPDHQPVMMVAVPFFHVTGLLPVTLVSAAIGRKIVILHKWDVEDAFRHIQDEGVTSFTGVPTMSYELAISPIREKYDVSTLVDLGGGGAARPPEHVTLIKEAYPGSTPGIGYGLTETNAMASMLAGPEYEERPNSVGRPTPPLIEIKVAHNGGESLPQGEHGEICIKSVMNISAYWNNPEATEKAFVDGWFRTGDVGYFDEEGYLHIVDRLKDIIIRGGENISSLEVEAVLHGIDGVDDVMVFSLPDKVLGEIVGAVVVAPDDSLTEEKIIATASAQLAKFKLPTKMWRVAEPLPLIASGKIDRKGIKTHYQDLYVSELKEE